MSFKEWKEVLLLDVIQFNPRESIKKGNLSKKIGMEKLDPYTRKINGYEKINFTSGTKFRNGDTLLARITPCLENGKTAQVTILEEDEVAFGSTEFIVMREKKGKTINDFIFYLAISDNFRNIAIKSMTGTSGRQRAQKDVIENSIITLPPIEEQKAIAKILSDLDNKIEVNNKINKRLEDMAQTIFKHWFVDFEFPNEEGKPYKSSGGEMIESELGMIPKGWEVKELGDISRVGSGKRPKKKSKEKNEEYIIPLIGASSPMGYVNDVLYNEKILVIGRVGTHGVVQRIYEESWPSDNTLIIIPKYYEYVYQILNLIDYKSLNVGSTQPLITQTDIKSIQVVLPYSSQINKFEEIVGILFSKVMKNNIENEKLSNLRDTLLPKLMSGEIRVPID